MEATSQRPCLEPYALGLAWALGLLLVLLRAASTGMLELGDGVNHHLIARYAWVHPHLFLDLWGKPLFTTLSSPFAQLGHAGMAGFNALVFVGTAIIGIHILRTAGGAAQMIFPILVAANPQYVQLVLGGMTEPLFAMLTLLALLLLLEGHYRGAALITSLTPLARPEYVVFIPLVAFFLVIHRRWRALPLLSTGLVVYALLTAITIGDPLHFWNRDPYAQPESIYGSGPWDHFLRNAEHIYGSPVLYLAILSLALWPLIHAKDASERVKHRSLLLIAAGTVLGVMLVHTVLWAWGTRGSAGLLRVIATVVPLAVLFTTYTLARVGLLLLGQKRIAWGVAGILVTTLALLVGVDLVQRVPLPVARDHEQLLMAKLTDRILEFHKPTTKILSTHPFVPLTVGIDPYDPNVYEQLWGWNAGDAQARLKEGDLLVWDARLGRRESNIAKELLLADPDLYLRGSYTAPDQLSDATVEPQQFMLFERRTTARSQQEETIILNGVAKEQPGLRADTIACGNAAENCWCFGEGDFPFEWRNMPRPDPSAMFDEWVLSCTVPSGTDPELRFVFTASQGGTAFRYQEVPAKGEVNVTLVVDRSDMDVELLLYLWNPNKVPFRIERMSLVRRSYKQEGS